MEARYDGAATTRCCRIEVCAFLIDHDALPAHWQAGGLAPPERVSDATAQLLDDLDPSGRFAKECLAEDEDAAEFLTTDELCSAYAAFLSANDQDAEVGPTGSDWPVEGTTRTRQVQRVVNGVRRRGLAGRKLPTRHSRDSYPF